MSVIGRNPLDSITLKAAEVIGANIIVKFNSSDKAKCSITAFDTDTDMVGITQFGGNTDEYLTITTGGIEFVKAGEVVVAGEQCSSDTAGKGKTGADGNYCIGDFMSSGNTDDLVPVRITKTYLETT